MCYETECNIILGVFMATQEPGRPVNELDILSNLNKKFLDQLTGLQINVK